MSIPQLGIAYWVESIIDKVKADSPAAKAGLLVGDEIREINFRRRDVQNPDEIVWAGFTKMASRRGKGQDLYDQWAYYHEVLQHSNYSEVRLRVHRNGALVEIPPAQAAVRPSWWTRQWNALFGEEEKVEQPAGIVAVPDLSWPQADRGLSFIPDTRQQKAGTVLQAFAFGIEDTSEFIRQIYTNLTRLLSRRISTRSLGGPIEIASQAYTVAGEDLATFALFLAMISINLAVVNFLPIPLLDGGHMVFLVYEKLRGRPPSEMVRAIASYIGLAMIVSLMLFVIGLDISRRWF